MMARPDFEARLERLDLALRRETDPDKVSDLVYDRAFLVLDWARHNERHGTKIKGEDR